MARLERLEPQDFEKPLLSFVYKGLSLLKGKDAPSFLRDMSTGQREVA
jgi:hypothetical protein